MGRCCVEGCTTSSTMPSHRLPRKEIVRQKWLESINRKDLIGLPENELKKYKVCFEHFNASDYLPYGLRRSLKDGAVPHLGSTLDLAPFMQVINVPATNDTEHQGTSETGNNFNGPSHIDRSPPEATENNDAVDSSDEHSSSERQNQEELSTQLILNDERKELCRLCGKKVSRSSPIFQVPSSDSSSFISVLTKIEMYLPFKVKEDDTLPHHVCSNCCDILNHWHEFYVTSVAADTALWKIFGRKTDMSPDVLVCSNASVEEIQQNAASKTVEVQTDIQEKHLVPLSEFKERGDAENGENSNTDNRSFIVEFDRNFSTFHNFSYKCKYCHELFKNPAHRRNHVAKCCLLSTICELCGLKISCRKALRKHTYLHEKKLRMKDIRYPCSKCSKFFKTTDSLNRHIVNIHNTKDHSKKYFCELCCSAFKHEINFQIHKRNHEKGKIKTTLVISAFRQENNSEDSEKSSVYSCPVCHEKFNDMLSLVVHLTTKKKIKCKLCRKIMPCEKRFFLHKCQVWTCQYCLMTFDQRVKWLLHERRHTGEKPIKCRVCDQTFRTWQARRYHENRHNSPLECSYCGKSFKNKYSFQDHVLCHEGKEFLCHICDKKFSGRRNLRKHVKIFHKNVENVT